MGVLLIAYRAVVQAILDNAKPVLLVSTLVAIGGYLTSIMGVLPWQYRLETERCMEGFGCFTIDGDYSLRPFNVLPQHRHIVDTKFILYGGEGGPAEYSYRESESLVSGLMSDKALLIVVHGWISSRSHFATKKMIDSLVTAKAQDLNIILVEWERGSTQTYPQAVANTRVVGAELAKFLSSAKRVVSLDRVHLVGVSLGAHVSGTCGSLLSGIGRITALDAAGPLFEHYPPSIRLDPSDAVFVDAIHTDGDDFYKVVIAEGGLGIHHSIGHADFYPNGGHSQPHCAGVMKRTLTELTSGDFSNVRLKKLVACDHELSLDYFTLSFTTRDAYIAYGCQDDQQGFINGMCNTTNYMGYQAYRPPSNAKYYLHMSHTHPYQGSHYMVSLTVEVPGLVCLSLRLSGTEGVAHHIDGHNLSKNCSDSSSQTAMLFSDRRIGAPQELTVVWENHAKSHDQVLAHGLTQLTIANVTISQLSHRYFSCDKVLLGFTQSVRLPISDVPCKV